MNRRWVRLLTGGIVAAGVVGLLWWRAAPRGKRPDDGARGEPVARPSADAAALGAATALVPVTDAAPAAPRPSSPLGAVAFYAARLKACEPPVKPPGPNPPITSFGHGESGWGVTFEVTAAGDLLAAKRWGRAGKMEACVTSAVASWPIAAAGKRVMTVDYPMHDVSYGRRPAGDVQLLASSIYDEKAISPAFLTADWLAICPRPGGSDLIPAAPVAKRGEVLDGFIWEVKSNACPGDDVVMVRGAEVGRWTHAAAPADGVATDASVTPAPDAGADRQALPTIAVDREKVIGPEGTTLKLGDRSLRLFTEDVAGNGEAGQQMLLLASHDVVQVLGDIGSEFRLVWAGDLDGDGGIDLVTCNFPEAPTYELFLSSHARGRLVRRAASAIGTDGD